MISSSERMYSALTMLMLSSRDLKPCPFALALQEAGLDAPLSWQRSSSGYQLAPVTLVYHMNEGWKMSQTTDLSPELWTLLFKQIFNIFTSKI